METAERTSFLTGSTPKQDIAMRREVDVLALKSLRDIATTKMLLLSQPVSAEEEMTRKLQPNFNHERAIEKRRTHPIFHSDARPHSPRVPAEQQANVPPYNPLDKGVPSSSPEPTKRLPYSKPKKVTTLDLKKPHVTTVGVVPHPRHSAELPELKVMLQGQAKSADLAADAPRVTTDPSEALANQFAAVDSYAFVISDRFTSGEQPVLAFKATTEAQPQKPAILNQTGTLQPAVFSERHRPPAKPITRPPVTKRHTVVAKQPIKDIEQRGGGRELPHELAEPPGSNEYDADRPQSSSSKSSIRSVSELLEEAKEISSSGFRIHKSKAELASAVSPGIVSKKKHSERAAGASDETAGVPAVRTVDQIIQALKIQKTSDVQPLTDADKKIQEIMNRVMKNATSVLADIGHGVHTEESTEALLAQPEATDGSHTPRTAEDGNLMSDMTAETEELKSAANADVPASDVKVRESDAVQAPTISLIPPSPDAGSVPATAASEKRSGTQLPISNSAGGSARTSALRGEPTLDNDLAIGCTSEEPDDFDVKQAYRDLVANLVVRHEDVVFISGKREPLAKRERSAQDGRARKRQAAGVALASSRKSDLPPSATVSMRPLSVEDTETRVVIAVASAASDVVEERGTHFFCSSKNAVRLPRDLAAIVRLSHAPDAFRIPHRHPTFAAGLHGHPQLSFSVDIERELSEFATWQRRSEAAERILKDAEVLTDNDFEAWQRRAAEVFSEAAVMEVVGIKAAIVDDDSKLFWNPAPPKMGVHPADVRRHLFPEYFGASLPDDGWPGQAEDAVEDVDDDSSSQGTLTADTTDRDMTRRILLRRHHSAQDLTQLLLLRAVTPTGSAGSQGASRQAASDSRHTSASSTPRQRTSREGRPNSKRGVFTSLQARRSRSLELLMSDDVEPIVSIPEDYTTAMAELVEQKTRLRQAVEAAAALQPPEDEAEEYDPAIDLNDTEGDAGSPTNAVSAQRLERRRKALRSTSRKSSRATTAQPTLAELALASGRSYVVYKPKKKKPAGKVVDLKRIDEIEAFLYREPNRIERSTSFSILTKATVDRSLRVPSHVRSQRRSSLPRDLEESELKEKHPAEEGIAFHEYIRNIWENWFEEVFPLPKEESRPESAGEEKSEATGDDADTVKDAAAAAEKEEPPLTDAELERLESLEPLEQTEEGAALREVLQEEVLKMTEKIGKSARPLPFDLCRRGALLRKLGQVVKAKHDLDQAIAAEPMLVHAYWQRHLLYLLQGKKTDALDDLNSIIKINRNHVGAYVSRAEILTIKDPTIAITNLTQALKIEPTNAEVYMKRAGMYEQRGQVLLAMEDYAKAYKLNPRLTIAIFKRGSYYFNHQSWQPAVNDFSEVLKKEPGNAAARLYRGRCYTKLGLWQQAVQDLSAAIHYDPNSWEAYYWRGCAFRKCNPRQALLDYSVSILINDGEDNIKSLLHRGILYDAMGRPEDAVPDFEAILKLRKDVSVAHLNLGLIYLTKMQWYPKAIKKFTAAIACDPTFVRAYVCRAEAYTELREYKSALLDYTRAIHLKPNVPHFYMHRGELLLKCGRTDLASFCVRHVSELFADADLGQSATQQAVVHSFLKNYQKAISALTNTLKSNPTSSVYVLLGKTQMMAKLWKDAGASFQCALDLMKPDAAEETRRMFKPWKPKDKWPKEAAEVNYLIGLCCMELRNYLGAHDAFNNAIDIDRKYAEALYQRGVAKLRLKQAKGIQDVNRALALDPKIFQAFLTRASYYGMRGQISKAIMNCNEAVRLKPQSVRAYLYRGALKCHSRAYELAIKDLTVATTIDTQCALAYFNRAVCYHESGQYQRALADYSVVLLLGDQLMLKVLINRGLLYLSHADYQNALYDFLLAAKVNTYDPKIRHTLGLCMHKLRRLKEAVIIFTETLKIDPHFIEAYVSRGNAYLDYGCEAGLHAAMCDYQRALMLRPNFLPARINMAYGLQSRGKLQQAWRQFTVALEADRRCSAAFEGRAVVNLQAGNLFAALQDINASLALRPSAELYNNRGVINQFMQDRVGAMHDFQMAIKHDPTYALSYFNAGNMYFTMRHFKQAKLYYDEAIQFNNRDESATVNRALAKAMLKDIDGALQDFETAIALSPKFAHVYFNRGNVYATQGQYEASERDYCKALELQPDDALVYKKRADVRGKMGRKEAAVDDYRRAVELQARVENLRKIQASRV